MIQDLEQDITASHGIINYLQAGYQGIFTQYNILSRLGSQKFNPQLVNSCGELLSKIARWNSDLAKGNCLVAASWEKPQTFEASEALNLLGQLRSDLLNGAAETAACLSEASLTLASEAAKVLLANFGRFAYSREHYIRGFVDLGKLLSKQELVDQYSSYLTTALEDVNLTHKFLEGFQQTDQQQTANMLSNLRYLCMRLPGAFRAQAHDIAQLIARFAQGPSFDAFEIPVGRATSWKDYNITPAEAGYWEAHFIGPDEAVAWAQAGLDSHDQAANWRIHGFNPHTASPWAKAGFPVQVALTWALAGFEPDKAMEFIKAGVTDPKQAQEKKPTS